jgi:A/G-specific adenine glycosylase
MAPAFKSPDLNRSGFRRNLLGWYDRNARDLPWRRSSDPYAIWVSEIMLQQTRVAAVLDHYDRFLRRFPNVQALAAAPEDEVLAIWSGLGYYRRARMMHRAAKVVVDELAGKFPETAAELRMLPGIGEYTSAAIASIGFGEAVAAIDGNVERVLTRVLGWDESTALVGRLREEAAKRLAQARPGDFNQAMMELGATVCLPRGPLCLQCPVQAQCATRGEHAVGERKKMKSRQAAYAFVQRRSERGGRRGVAEVLLTQRGSGESLMPGMWELPSVDVESTPAISEDRRLLDVRHSITVTNYYVTVYRFDADDVGHPETNRWFAVSELAAIPLTGLARKVLKRLKALPGYTGGQPLVRLDEVAPELSQ